MEKAILGTKIGMTQIFGEGGVVIPVTVVMAGPCVVTQKKTVETDGYEAVQVGFGDVKEKHLNKPQLGHFKKADTANKKYVREFRLDDCESLNVGDEIKADIFAAEFLAPSGELRGLSVSDVQRKFGVSALAAKNQLRQASNIARRHASKKKRRSGPKA